MSSEAKRSMGPEGPYQMDLLFVLQTLKHVPYKYLKFVTIKDSRQDAKIKTVGNVYDYLKRFSQKMWIVMSPKGGTHFHALIMLKPLARLSFKKGVHIDVKDVGGPKPDWDPEFIQRKLDDASEMYTEALERTNDVKHAIEVYDRVMAPPSKEYQRLCRGLAKDKKTKHITNIVKYLHQNLNESPAPHFMYQHYIYKSKDP